MYFIYNKHYIKYNACYKFPMLKTSFYPDAYKFINTRGDFEKYTELIDNTINLSSNFEFRKLDFEKYTLNSAVFFLVRKFYMLRCLFGALYVDMRCFGVFGVFSKHTPPHPNQWGSMKNHKK